MGPGVYACLWLVCHSLIIPVVHDMPPRMIIYIHEIAGCLTLDCLLRLQTSALLCWGNKQTRITNCTVASEHRYCGVSNIRRPAISVLRECYTVHVHFVFSLPVIAVLFTASLLPLCKWVLCRRCDENTWVSPVISRPRPWSPPSLK